MHVCLIDGRHLLLPYLSFLLSANSSHDPAGALNSIAMRRIIILWLCIQGASTIHAQQDLGVRNSHYAGIQAALLNPAGMEGQYNKWDVNVVSLGTLFDNNYLYIPKGAVPVLGFGAIIKGIKHQNKFVTHFNPANPDKRYHFILAGDVLGPSFQAKIAEGQTIGFAFRARAYANINDFTGHVAQNAYDYMRNKILWNTPFHDNSTRIDGMAWLEYGVYYAATIFKDSRGELAVGVGLKYLQGLGAAYVKNTSLNYTVGDTTQLIFTQSNLDYGKTDYDSYRRRSGHRELTHGYGLGANIGITYTRSPYKFGLSLIDAGAIRFNKNAAAFHLHADSANFTNWYTYNLTTNQQVDRTISAAFYDGDSTRSHVGNSFKMGLPAALSFQADWNCYDNFFVNATIIKGFGHGHRQGVVQPDVYSITPRYESKWLELSIPFSVIYYGSWRPRLGFAARAGYLFFGGDAPAGLFRLRNMYGTDFYIGVHFFSSK